MPVILVFPPGSKRIVNFTWAMKSPGRALRIGNGVSSSCSTHSRTPSLAWRSSSKALRVKGRVGNFLLISEKNTSGSLHLQIIVLVDISLEHSGSNVLLTGFTISSGHSNIHRIHFIGLKGALFNLAIILFAKHDMLGSINDVSLHLIHNSTNYRLDAIGSADLLDSGRNLLVGVSGPDQSAGHLGTNVRSVHTIGLGASDHLERVGSHHRDFVVGGSHSGHDESMGGDSDVAIHLASQITLHRISSVQRNSWV
mmetsp:Transcript_91218/g.197278  ORF Transcript_91218/g.197278 Transcript_91218/m.197278 type:complete len:254 (-) Transcript_91218:348-1109(-)